MIYKLFPTKLCLTWWGSLKQPRDENDTGIIQDSYQNSGIFKEFDPDVVKLKYAGENENTHTLNICSSV